MKILVIAEHDNVALKSSCHASVVAATTLSTHLNSPANIDVLLAGDFNQDSKNKLCNELINYKIINKILFVSHKNFEHGLAESLAELIANVGKDYDYIILPANTYGKNIAPRAAALLDINPLNDVIEIISADTFNRPIYAGNVIATIRLKDKIKLFTVRPTSFEHEVTGKDGLTTTVVELENKNIAEKNSSRFIDHQLSDSARPELSSAKIVVSGGRALGSKENFKLIDDLADKLNAAVGASRAAVDAGYVANDYQVGQTGKVVAPDLYIAVGISGAIQHIAGIRDSRVIVAINKDADAPIFKIADYGVVGDLFELIPEFTKKITELRK